MQIVCPMHHDGDGSCDELVEVELTFDSTVKVAPCASLRAQGWGDGPQVVFWRDQFDAYVERTSPSPQPALWQHRDGLVTLVG